MVYAENIFAQKIFNPIPATPTPETTKFTHADVSAEEPSRLSPAAKTWNIYGINSSNNIN